MNSRVEGLHGQSTTRSTASLVFALTVHGSLALAQTAPPAPSSPADALAPKPDAARVYPLAARFAPGEEAAVTIQAVSPTNTPFIGPIELTVFHLNDQVYHATSDPITLRPDATVTTSFEWMPPPTDFTGYLAVMSVDGRVIGSTGIDVSSTALGYPRYGYLSNFSPTQTPEVLNPIVQRLALDYHLNAFQFYDWFWRHEKLIERDNANNLLPTWDDLFGRTNSVQVLSDLISSVHQYKALAMAYVMIYAARENYAQLWPIEPSWGMFTQPNAVSQLSLDFSAQKPGERLFLFDPSNPGWQAWMTSEYVDAIRTFGFDGVHIDQLGERRDVLRADGSPLDLPHAFVSFLEAADLRLAQNDPQRSACTFNIVDGTVDGWAVREVAQSAACKFLYSEIWFKTNTYADLRRYIEQLRSIGRGRPVVLAAYAQYGEETGPIYEAEGQTTLNGAGISNNVPGFTGFGFVDGMDNAGDSILWTINVPESSTESLVFRYANASGRAVKAQVSVNGSPLGEVEFPSLGQWSVWATSFHADAQLAAGSNTVSLTVGQNTGGAMFVDSLRLSQFDENAVRLELAAIYASGATPIIIGDDQQSLGSEYYPDRSKAIPPPLKRAIRDDQSFISAYETLLFPPEVISLGDGTSRLVAISGERLIDNGGNGIWVLPRRIGPYDMIHLINLVSLDDAWRNAKQSPPIQTDIMLRYYVDADISGVYIASPDLSFGQSTSLPYASGRDDRGRYVEFTVPRLDYWDMVYLRRGG